MLEQKNPVLEVQAVFEPHMQAGELVTVSEPSVLQVGWQLVEA